MSIEKSAPTEVKPRVESEGWLSKIGETIANIGSKVKGKIWSLLGWTNSDHESKYNKHQHKSAKHDEVATHNPDNHAEEVHQNAVPDMQGLDELVHQGRINVFEGEPSVVEADGIIVGVNTTNQTTGGGTLAGAHLQNDDGSPIKVGDVVVTKSTQPDAAQKYIIQVAMHGEKPDATGPDIEKAILGVLQKAKENGLKSIILQDMSNSTAGLGPEPVAIIMRDAMAKNIELVKFFDSIKIVLQKPGGAWERDALTPAEIFQSTFGVERTSNVVAIGEAGEPKVKPTISHQTTHGADHDAGLHMDKAA